MAVQTGRSRVESPTEDITRKATQRGVEADRGPFGPLPFKLHVR